jgi:hypothetical protein
MGYLDNEGAVITTGYKRLSFNLNGSLQAKENLNFNGRVVYSNSKTTSPALSDNITFLRIAGLPRTAKFKFEDGSLAPGQHQNMGNPLYQLTRRVYWNDYDNLTISLGADWENIPGLTFNPQVSMYNVYSNTNSFQKLIGTAL